MVLLRLAAAPASLPDLGWDNVTTWLVDKGLPIVGIVIGSVMLRWIVHRTINQLVSSLVRGRRADDDGATSGGRLRRSRGERTAPPVPETVVTSPALPARHEGSPPGEVAEGNDSTPRWHSRPTARPAEGRFINPERQRQRVETLGSVLRSIATIVILTIAILMIGEQLGLNMAPLLASAGVGGVALGFGAQSLVKDFLSGIFMLAEDQYGVGDFIDAGVASGTVEEVTLRVTRLRDVQGVIWYIRNGEITRVANKSQGWSTAIVDIPVAYDESPERVITVLAEAMKGLDGDPEWEDVLMERPKVMGVESVSGGTMSIRILARCAPNEHWGAQREIRERGLTACVAAGIRGPVVIGPYLGGHA
ncbi:mechanosensitive ion channel family protein [Austwickia sp. TVS 96-490-7B]|uniref:mechanosensitive ion channel family protein n=1 Tax=Austwickia sp. TVS 96-490-7B TaxID=2830843 RepID=UPI002105B0AA|nr:mechanosensitive ion channel family protein [Austwickia sp. TVS 96-490-7B]